MEPSSSHIVCPACDLLLKSVLMRKGEKAYCPRCNTMLHQDKNDTITKVLAISTAGLTVYIPAVFMDIFTLNLMGLKQSASVFDTFLNFYNQQYYFVAVLILLTAILFPLLRLSILFTVSLQLKIRLYSKSLPLLLRTARYLDEWGMADVYLIGILISIIKIHKIATISYDTGFYCFIILTIMTRATSSAFGAETFWRALEHLKKSVYQGSTNIHEN